MGQQLLVPRLDSAMGWYWAAKKAHHWVQKFGIHSDLRCVLLGESVQNGCVPTVGVVLGEELGTTDSSSDGNKGTLAIVVVWGG